MARIESIERKPRLLEMRRLRGLRSRHKQFLLLAKFAHAVGCFHMRKLVALLVIAVIASSILFGNRLIVNRTHSLPVGLYYWSDVPIKKGSIVLCKPDHSTPLEQLGLERGYEARALPLLKRVVALAGDLVSVSSSGVSVNGDLLANSAPLSHDEAGRPLAMAQLDQLTWR
jgi:conjugative transfer signal peptidase TraF